MYLGICLQDFFKMLWENWFSWRLENAQKVALETLSLVLGGPWIGGQ